MTYRVTLVPRSGGQIPYGADPAGWDTDGTPLFAGRAMHLGELIPAKVKPGHGAWVAWGGEEHHKEQYEVLVSHAVAWKYCRDGNIPPDAIVFGCSASGEPLYMGRTFYEGTITPGKVQRSHGCLYISFAGKEISCKNFEVLVKAF